MVRGMLASGACHQLARALRRGFGGGALFPSVSAAGQQHQHHQQQQQAAFGLGGGEESQQSHSRRAFASSSSSSSSGSPHRHGHGHDQEWGFQKSSMSLRRPGPEPNAWQDECRARRQLLTRLLAPGSVVLVPSSPQLLVPGTQIPLPYRQEATFYYLTGVYADPDMIAALEVNPTGEKVTYRLFHAEASAERERWEGARTSLKDMKHLQCDSMCPLSGFPAYLDQVVSQNRPIIINSKMWKNHKFGAHLGLHGPNPNNRYDLQLVRGQGLGLSGGGGSSAGLSDYAPHPGKCVLYDTLEQVTHAMRWRKSAAELGMMRESAEITTEAFKCVMRAFGPGSNEADISALFEFLCHSQGADRMPYPQVVAGGNSACTIHYSRNNRKVFDGELLLMDAGCDFHGYVSDVTRTWPIGGRFTPPQREVYEHVLRAHEKCLEMCVEGATLRDIHKVSVQMLAKSLRQLGIVNLSKQGVQQIIMQGLYKPYYPHSIGHWLGMDTHDVHTVSALKPLEAGCVLTVEPGLYLPRNVHEIPAQYRGIGIRLEDDVVVRSGGQPPEVISGGVPITVEDVEALVQEGLSGQPGEGFGGSGARGSFPWFQPLHGRTN